MSETTPFKININNFTTRPGHVLSKAHVGQILKTMFNSVEKTSVQENDYQKILYPCLQECAKKLKESFDPICVYESEVERNVKTANLFTSLPRNNDSNLKFYSKVQLNSSTSFGPLLKTLVQRVNHVLDKETPKRYLNNKEEGENFDKLLHELHEFKKVLDDVQDSYTSTITEARKLVNMDAVSQRRKEKREQRKLEFNNKKKRQYNKEESAPSSN